MRIHNFSAVKNHQKVRLDLVQEELNKEKTACSNLKFEVNKLEQEIIRKQQAEKNSFSYVSWIQVCVFLIIMIIFYFCLLHLFSFSSRLKC